MKHEPSDCNGGHGCGGKDCCCPCHFEGNNQKHTPELLEAALEDGDCPDGDPGYFEAED
jgi:hypothetical protein